VRWGRTVCPANGTELVYAGMVSISHIREFKQVVYGGLLDVILLFVISLVMLFMTHNCVAKCIVLSCLRNYMCGLQPDSQLHKSG
jgi:hypothetical protein